MVNYIILFYVLCIIIKISFNTSMKHMEKNVFIFLKFDFNYKLIAVFVVLWL